MDQYWCNFFSSKENSKKKEMENRAKLDVMRYIRECSGKKYDKPVTLADWDDKSNLEQEIVDQMRHLGLKSWSECSGPEEPLNLPGLPPSKSPMELGTGNNSFPLVVDPEYFNRLHISPVKNKKDV
nr:uncharacterized protein LOC108012019 [Drosophila suzukii]